MSYCHWPVSVVRRASSVVRRQQFALNNISSETIRPRALIFGMHCLVDLYQVCSNGGPGVQNGPAAGGLGFKIEIYLKNLLLQNCLAQGLEIWYIALPDGPLPSLFKWWPWGPKWPCGGGSWVQNRNILEKSSSPELLGSGA